MSVRPSKTSVARSRNRRVDHSALGRACGAVLGTFEALERRVLMTAAPVIVYPFEDSPTGTTVEDTSVEGSDNDGTLKGDNAGVYSGTNPLVDDPSLYPVFMPASGTGADSPSPAGGQFMRFSGDNAFNGAGSRVQTQDFLGGVDANNDTQGPLDKSATISFWIRTSAVGTGANWQWPGVTGAEHQGDGNDVFWGIQAPDGQNVVTAGDNAGAGTVTPINDGDWHQIVETRDSVTGRVACYMDGKLRSQAVIDRGEKGVNFNSIGAVGNVGNLRRVDGWAHLGGDLDNVEVYDRTLGAREVAARYAAAGPAPAAPSGLTATANGARAIDLSFTDNSNNEAGFEIQRSRSATGPFVAVGSLGPDVTTFTDTGLFPGTQYFYRVIAFGATNESAPSNVANATTEQLNVATDVPPAGPGALARYYNASTPQPLPDGDPVFIRTEPNISFASGDNFGNGSPDPSVNSDNYSGVWTGMITVPQTGTYRFDTNTDDGAFVFVNGLQVVNDPTYHGTFVRPGDQTINLTAGQSYCFYMKFFEGGGGSAAELRWLLPNGTEEVIPASAFTSNRTGTGTTTEAPTGFATSAIDSDFAVVTFANDKSCDDLYFVELATGSTFNAANVVQDASYGPQGGPFVFTGLSRNTTYTLQAKAFNQITGMSAPSTFTFTTAAAPVSPAAPTALRVLPRAGATKVIFVDNSANETQFVIEKSVGGGAFAPAGTLNTNLGESGATLTFTDVSTTAGQAVQYRIKAVGRNGAADSAYSNVVGATINAGTGLLATVYETRFFEDNPDNDADPYTEHNFTLDQNWGSGGPDYLTADPSSTNPDDTWSVVFDGQIQPEFSENYTFYTASDDGIQLRITDPATGTVLLDGPPNGIQFLRGISGAGTFQDTVGTIPMVAGKKYDIRVIWSENGGGAAWRVGWSSPSIPQEVIPDAVLYEPDATVKPLKPASLTARPGATGIVLRWDDRSSNEDQFLIERKEGTGAFTQIGTAPRDGTASMVGGAAPFIDTTAVVNHTYTYRVIASNAAGNSDPSNEATVTAGGAGGNGLLGTVYETRFFQPNPDSTDADPHIDHDRTLDENWGSGGPAYLEADPSSTNADDTWSIAFTGQVQAEFSEPYTFYTASDDGIELTLVDPATGQVVLTGPPNGIQYLRGIGYPYQDNVGTVNLVAGKRYNMQVRWTENGGGAAWRVAWSSPSIPFEVIPDVQLFEPAGTEAVTPVTNLSAAVLCADRVTLSWVDTAITETGFTVQRATNPAGPFTNLGTLTPNVNGQFVDTGPLTVNTDYFYRVVTNGPGGPANSQVLTAHTYDGSTVTDTNLQLNGTATFITVPATVDDDTQALRLTDNVNSQSGTAFLKQARDVNRDWTTTFDWYIPERSGSRADGFTFMIQSNSPTAVGGGGGSLAAQGIPNSLAVKFDIYPNLQNQTGIYVNGEAMADDGTDIGFDIANGHRYHATITFDSNPTEGDPNDALTLKIEDVTDPSVTPFEQTFTTTHDNSTPFDIADLLGGSCGFIGFTGATGGENAEQDLLDWTFNGQNIPFAPNTLTHVTQVFVNGGGLTGQTTANGVAFRAMAGIDNTFGYPIPTGANQLKSIPWVNGINAVSLRFDQDVASSLGQGDLVVRGVNNATYTVTGFSYDAATKTGTWTLSTPITNDKVRLFVDDALVQNLDGEWADSTDTFPSGNGTAGGDFAFRFNVLRGDATQDGRVNALDLSYIKQRLNKTATNPGTVAPYTPFADLTADGSINALDLSAARARLNNALPTGEPATALLFSTRAISR